MTPPPSAAFPPAASPAPATPTAPGAASAMPAAPAGSPAPTGTAARLRAPSLWGEVRALLPEGFGLPKAAWDARHRFILVVLAAHAILLPAFGAYHGWPAAYALGEPALVGALALLAALPRLSRRVRSNLAAFALVTSSSILVQFSGGTIEAHFHYFIAVALIALYQDWAPFLLSFAYVGLHHGVLGSVEPHWVYNHHAALADPWRWALIHALAILGEAVALLAFWAGAEQARARSDLILDSAGDAVIGFDLKGRVTFANPAAAALVGRPGQELVGRDARALLQGVPLPSGVGSPQGPRQAELAAADGRSVPVEFSLTPALRGGVPLGFVIVLRDVAARRDLERQLVLHREHLEELVASRTAQLTAANREMEAFSYTVSHDLRSPLRSIDGFSRILLGRHGHELPDDSRRMLQMLSGGAVRMGNLIESVLSLSRISRTKLASERLDLSLMAHEILEELAVKDPERRVDWVVQPGLTALGDPGLVRLALGNLLGNAWKFTSKAGAARISFHRAESQGAPVFVVEDNGAGFDMAHARDLFQPFHRMHQAHEFEGTGIGLATVNRILQRHGGRIWAEGKPGQGARFYFTLQPQVLPAAASPASAPLPAASAAPEPAPAVVELQTAEPLVPAAAAAAAPTGAIELS